MCDTAILFSVTAVIKLQSASKTRTEISWKDGGTCPSASLSESTSDFKWLQFVRWPVQQTKQETMLYALFMVAEKVCWALECRALHCPAYRLA